MNVLFVGMIVYCEINWFGVEFLNGFVFLILGDVDVEMNFFGV